MKEKIFIGNVTTYQEFLMLIPNDIIASFSKLCHISVEIAGGGEVCVQGEGRLHLRLLHPLHAHHPWLHRLLRMHHLYSVGSNDEKICSAGYEDLK